MNDPYMPRAPFSAEDIKEKTQQALQAPQVQKTKSFYERNQTTILTGVVLVVGLKVYKRKVAKTTAKAVVKALSKQTGLSTPSTMLSVLDDLRKMPGQALIDDENNMIHLLKGKDVVVTVFGDFNRMDTEEIWNYVAEILNLGVVTRAS